MPPAASNATSAFETLRQSAASSPTKEGGRDEIEARVSNSVVFGSGLING